MSRSFRRVASQAFSSPSMEQKPDPEYLGDMMTLLHGCIDDLQLPPLIDRTATPTGSDAHICCVFLSMPDERLAPILNGGKSPGTVFLALAHTWIDRIGDDLWLHQGISADASGQLTMQRFEPPRRITYFANFFTSAASYRTRDEGNEFFSESLRTPTSSSPALETFVNDKLYTRTLLARGLVSFPTTLAFGFMNRRSYSIRVVDVSRIKVIPSFSARQGNEAIIRREVSAFAKRIVAHASDTRRFVVKPSGPLWMESKGVAFFDISDIDGAVRHVEALLQGYSPPSSPEETLQCSEGDSILVEEYLPTMPMQNVVNERDVGIATAGGAGYQLVDAAAAALHMQDQVWDDADTTLGFSDTGDAIPVDVGDIRPPTFGGEASPPDAKKDTGGTLPQIRVKPLAFRLRCIVTLDATGRPTVSAVLCGVGPSDHPLNGTNTVPATLDQVLTQWGILDEGHKDRIRQQINREGERVMQVISDAEDLLPADVRGGRNAFTDVVGIDFLLAQRRGMITPYVIEVNDHDCFFAVQQLEHVIPSTRGKSTDTWLERMVYRSHKYLLQDTVAVVIGGGGHSKAFVWDETREWQMRIILVDQDDKHYARDKAWRFIHFPELADHTKDKENAAALAQRIRELVRDDPPPVPQFIAKYRAATSPTHADPAMAAAAAAGEPGDDEVNRRVHGVITFWEDATVVTAMVARQLGCIANDPVAQHRVKNKFECCDFLGKAEMKTLYLPPVKAFTAAVHRIRSAADLAPAIEAIPLPAVLKLEYGSSAVGVKLVQTPEDVRTTYESVQDTLHGEDAHGGCGLGFNSDMILMEYLDGTEHDVDLVIFGGQLVCAFVTDNSPTRLPYFCETAAVMPSQLSYDKQQMMVFAAHHVCRAAGLKYGVFNVEMKYTATGPRLIEINGRMGGFYIRDWIKRLYGVDLLRCAFLCSFGVRPVVPSRTPETNTTIVGLMLYASQHGNALRQVVKDGRLKRLGEKNVAVVSVFEAEVPEIGEYEEPYGNVAIAGPTAMDAGQKLMAMCRTLGFDEDADPPPEYFLRAIHCL
eukprot:TRINITY_DN1866_c0_g1_i1.p1 TRINITY_DN1866_c0_g1~~TRINITY_DN1866_c0_g1_i1.p1  ORF type:complete len:1044 (+),score=311.26 TRINITY_DN1866_c0_g1_i1:216-3347(+)